MSPINRRAALFITFFTGFSGLVFEVTWQKYLSNLLGSEAKANAIILAVFLGCLALGYIVFGRWSKAKSPRLLINKYGRAELTIGLWSVAFLLLHSLFWQHLTDFNQNFWLATVTDVLMCTALIGVPSFLMGGTLPLLTQGLGSETTDSARWHAQIYATNTLGAFVGAIAAGFVLLPLLGLRSTLLIVSVIDIFAGILFILKSTSLSPEPFTAGSVNESDGPLRVGVAAALAFVAGFISLTTQVVALRTAAQVFGSSEYTFSMVVGAFVLLLALGAWAAQWSRRHLGALAVNFVFVGAGLLLFYIVAPKLPVFFYQLRWRFQDDPSSFYLYTALQFSAYAALLFITVVALGRTLPLLFAALNKRADELGVIVGRVYGLNAIGCVLGAWLGGFYLFYFIDIEQIIKACAFLAAAASLALAFSNNLTRSIRAFLFVSVALISGASLYLPTWDQTIMSAGYFRAYNFPWRTKDPKPFQLLRILAHKDDPISSVTISQEGPMRSLWVNGKSDGATFKFDYVTTHMVAHVPLLLAPKPVSKVAVIGFGTGHTAGVLSLYPEIKEIHVTEISPAVRDFAPLFDFSNHNISQNPKFHWHMGDAFRFLANDQAQYSLIISEPSNPWVTGVERLYTRDFYQRVITRLEPGAFYVQWFHLYEISNPTLGVVLKTFSSVFTNVKYFVFGKDVVLVGCLSPFQKTDEALANDRFAQHEVQQDLKELDFASWQSVLANELKVKTESYAPYALHTLERPILSYRAEKDFYQNSQADLAPFK